jgi:hypothetical protein
MHKSVDAALACSGDDMGRRIIAHNTAPGWFKPDGK